MRPGATGVIGATDWVARLASGEPIEAPIAVVVAHPDDETLWTGGLLSRARDATVILLTDGAPRDMGDAARLGISSRAAYARRRADEMDVALAALGFRGRLLRYDVPDQEAVFALDWLAARIARDTADSACIVTHPYDGGHPDHDAAACAVARVGHPAVVEFACYAQREGERRFGAFVDDPQSPAAERALTAAEQACTERALAAYASQHAVFGDWRPTRERWRAAPRYRFDQPPPGEACLYDGFGWPMTSARWRACAIVRAAA